MKVKQCGGLVVPLLLGAPVILAARAQSAHPPDVTMVSRDDSAFIQGVRSARRAIFNGDPQAAKDLMRKARSSLKAAEKEARNTAASGLIPVDGQVVIADDYVPRPQRQTHIDKANEHLKRGEARQAVEELRQGRIDVRVNHLWAPIAFSEYHLDDAIEEADAGEYYEANLSLKAIEDGLTMDPTASAEPKNAK